MPKSADKSSIIVKGASSIIVLQAYEFKYCGTQVIKALMEE